MIVYTVAIAAIAMLLSACSSTTKIHSASRTTKVVPTAAVNVMTYSKSPISILSYIASSQGFFAKNHIKATLIPLATVATGIDATTTGAINVVEGSPLAILPFIAKGISLKVIMGASGQYFSIVAQQYIPKIGHYPSDLHVLAGKPVGVTGFNSEASVLLDIMLKQAGMSTSSVSIVNAGGNPGEIAELSAGKIAAAVANPSVVADTAVTSHTHVLVDFPNGKTGPTILRGLPDMAEWVLSSYYSTHRTVVNNLQHSWIEAYDWIRNPRNQAKFYNDVQKEVTTPYAPGSSQAAAFAKEVASLAEVKYSTSVLQAYAKVDYTYGLLKQPLQVKKLIVSGVPS